MYINDGASITNTPMSKPAYNTWTHVPPKNAWYQHVPSYYTDEHGEVHKIIKWGNGCYKILPGSMYKATPTRTGSWYQLNYVQIECPLEK